MLRDLINVERHSTTDTVVLLHDCLPLDEVTAGRERTTDFYSGDVWKAALVLRRLLPELEMITVRTAPTGLCLVRGLDGVDRRLEERDARDRRDLHRPGLRLLPGPPARDAGGDSEHARMRSASGCGRRPPLSRSRAPAA